MLDLKLIKHFNYYYLSGKFNIDPISQRSILFALFKVVAKGGVYVFYSFISLIRRRNYFSSDGRVVFFVTSENNYQSVKPIYEKLPRGSAVLLADKISGREIRLLTPVVLAALIAIVFFPRLLYDYFRSDKITKKNFERGISDIILTYPFYYTSLFWFKLVKPSGVVISNDHIYSTRILIYWANKFNIPSFYVQHASVTKEFPPLEMRYAFLEGEDAKDKYILAGSDPSKIELIGIPKLDSSFGKINQNNTIKAIGIASNGIDSQSLIFNLIQFLTKHYPDIRIVYRPHQSQYFDAKQKNELMEMINKLPKNVALSDSREEIVTDYLSKIDCLIASESSIHLEAILFNVTSFCLLREDGYYDYYGYVKSGLIEQMADFNALLKMIDMIKDNRPEVRHKAQKYCYTVGSDFDGRSADLAAELMMKKISITN